MAAPRIKTKRATNKGQPVQLTRRSLEQQEKWRQFWQDNHEVPSTGRYNLTISDAPKFIWYRNAKVATRTTFEILGSAGVEFTAAQARRCHYSPQLYRDYFKFAFVRNPWDRFVSGWLNKVVESNHLKFEPNEHQAMQQFESFVAYYAQIDTATCNAHFRQQNKLIDLNDVDFVGRQENFAKDLRQVFRHLKLPVKKIPTKNKSDREASYRAYYTEDTQNIVAKMYRKDIQVFGYTF